MRAADVIAPGRCSGPGARVDQEAFVRPTEGSATERRAQRLPAYGRRLRDAIQAGYRPCKGGGGVIVTSDWTFARAFHPARVVCPPGEAPESFDFGFLRGIDVCVLVPEVDVLHGEALRTALLSAGAALVALAIVREGTL